MDKLEVYYIPLNANNLIEIRARGYRTFFMLNSAEHGILKMLKSIKIS